MAVLIRITNSDGEVREVDFTPGDTLAIDIGEKIAVVGADPDSVEIAIDGDNLTLTIGEGEPVVLEDFVLYMKLEDGSVGLTVGEGDDATVFDSLIALADSGLEGAEDLEEFSTAAGGDTGGGGATGGTGSDGTIGDGTLDGGTRGGDGIDGGGGAGTDGGGGGDGGTTFVAINNDPTTEPQAFSLDEDGTIVSVRSGRGMGPVKRISHVEARPHKVLSFCW